MSAPGTTPGPWVLQADEIVGYDGSDIMEVQPNFGSGHYIKFSNLSDAHLIAASPALYGALEAMLDIAEVWEQLDCRQNIQLENSDTVAAARLALAQARGETA